MQTSGKRSKIRTTPSKESKNNPGCVRQSALSFCHSQGSGVRMAWGSSYLPFQGNAIKLSGRTFLAPHRGSCPKGLCKRTGFLGVKRRENPVRRHFERSEMRGQHYGISNIVRWPLACPYCLRHFPRRGEASHYGANDFLNLIALHFRGLLSGRMKMQHCELTMAGSEFH